MVVVLLQSAATTVRSLRIQGNCSNYGNPDDFIPKTTTMTTHHRLSLSKPAFIVRTQSNVRIMRRKKPEPFCAVCNGSGRVDCHHCHGKGRTNSTELMMLPKGQWPKWCKTCGGSGLGYCNRCVGTGEYRDIMGFHFMKTDAPLSQDLPINSQTDDKPNHQKDKSNLDLSEKVQIDGAATGLINVV